MRLEQRIIAGMERLSKPKTMYNFSDENISLPQGFWDESLSVRKAMAYRATLEAIKLPIYPGELIVGDVPYNEFRANKELITAFLPEDEKNTLIDMAKSEYKDAKSEMLPDFSVLRPFFHTNVNYGHIIADYAMLINTGFRAVANTVKDSNDDFSRSVKIALEGGMAYIKRYGMEAQRLANIEQDSLRQAELQVIAADCLEISEQPAKNFRQAVQLLWFFQLLMEIESGISAFSFGRMDQYLYPFLRKDLDSGVLTMDKAQEIIDSFFVKANEQNNVTGDAGRAITVGGILLGNIDSVNDCTYLLLHAAVRTRLLQPKLNARFHKNSPPEYALLCAQGAAQNAGVQMYNDDVIIPGLVKYGYKHEDAIDYGIIGCYEYGMAGIDRPSPMSVTMRLGKCLEEALFNEDWNDYDQLTAAFAKRFSFYTAKMADNMYYDELVCRKIRPLPFLSAFVGDCIKNGVDISLGGAVYNSAGVRFTGFSAVADSLAAIKKLVYERNAITKDELLDALKNDFANAEPLRQMLVSKAPKYGNDDDFADNIAVKLGEGICNEILSQLHISGAPLKPGLFSFLNFLDSGKNCGALPNGRKAGEPFVNGISPMHGADKQGPTAMLKSAAKLNYSLSPNGATLDLKLQGNLYNTPESMSLLAGMIRAFFNMGGAHVQAYSLTAEELEAAKREPEKYSNLLVRVTGYSAYFVDLKEDLQDEIIKRAIGF